MKYNNKHLLRGTLTNLCEFVQVYGAHQHRELFLKESQPIDDTVTNLNLQ